MTHLNICIIETGASHPTMAERYGRYPHMIAQCLLPVLRYVPFWLVSVFEGESIDLDHHDDDEFIVTGSPHGVYDVLPWLHALKELLREAATRGLSLLGICFGHQTMPAAFGGEVKK